VDARAPFDKGRLVAQRRAPKVPAGDLLDPDPFDRVRGLGASLRWDSITNRSRWSRKCPRVPQERSPSLGHVTDVPRVIPDSACSGRLSNPFEGPAFEPLISKGLGARVLWGGCRTPQGGFLARSNRCAGYMTCGPEPPCWTAGCDEAECVHNRGAVVCFLRGGPPFRPLVSARMRECL
jgi:hypothetical protein